MADVGNPNIGMAEQPVQPLVIVGDTVRVNINMLQMGVLYPFTNGEAQAFVVLRNPTQIEIYVPNIGDHQGIEDF